MTAKDMEDVLAADVILVGEDESSADEAMFAVVVVVVEDFEDFEDVVVACAFLNVVS